MVYVALQVLLCQLSLQALKNTKPIKAPIELGQDAIISNLQNEIKALKEQLQSTLDLKNHYEAELNKLGIFPAKVAKVPFHPEASMKKLSNHPVMSQEWMKDQMQQIPESERIFKSRKIPIPQEAFTSSLPDKK
ncbi:hypothetical protein SLK22_18515 [Acinetobacter pittii]|uniref:hypothetical protein n=1 Tax=Acinetobacter pittii TaxID=48296 RepID=UPI0029FF8944|nr:hypothetical protein [Acinetobacter pittii]MDX8273168.1 hypothetical protein [Acinetobacter pittii]